MAKVSVQNVSKTYAAEKQLPGVRDFNLEIEDREFVVFAGPRGCGNSSLVRMIAGLEEITKGEIRIGEKRVNDLPPRDRDVAMVFRSDALYPRMSVHDNMALGLKLRKFPMAEIKRRIAETASLLGLEQSLERKPGSLSAGERQRVALGRAIARQPKVFLFEEPLANLDSTMRLGMRTEILRLHQRLQATMIYATHDPVEAMTMGDRVVVIKEGVLQQIGAPARLYREPDNLFVAGYLGRPPMNLIRGKLREAGDALLFKEAGEGVMEIKLAGRPEARPFAGRDIIAGVRPEDIRIVTDPVRPGALRFRALLDVVEWMGAEANAHIETGAHTLVARTRNAPGNDEAGHRVQFEIDPAGIHLFDPETTRRITG
jgi:multiple sugar transport system ATP-binding protein